MSKKIVPQNGEKNNRCAVKSRWTNGVSKTDSKNQERFLLSCKIRNLLVENHTLNLNRAPTRSLQTPKNQREKPNWITARDFSIHPYFTFALFAVFSIISIFYISLPYYHTGDADSLYRCLIELQEGRHIPDEEYFPTYVKGHLDRGARLLDQEKSIRGIFWFI